MEWKKKKNVFKIASIAVLSPGTEFHHTNVSEVSRTSIRWICSWAMGDVPSTSLPLLRKPQAPPVQWAEQGVRLTEGECEGIGRCDLYGEGGSQISYWAPLEDKPCEYPDLLKRFPQTSYSRPLH